MNTLLKKPGPSADSQDDHSFRAAIRALRPAAHPSGALEEQVKTLAHDAERRLAKRQKVKRVASLVAGLCVLTLCSVNGPRLWAEYQLFQAARRVASAPNIYASITCNDVPNNRRELTMSGSDARMLSPSLLVTRHNGDVRYSFGTGMPTLLVAPAEGPYYGIEKTVADALTLPFLPYLRQAASPIPFSKTWYRLADWENNGSKLASATLTRADGRSVRIVFDSSSGLPTRLTEKAPDDGRWHPQTWTMLSYTSLLDDGWFDSFWETDLRRKRQQWRRSLENDLRSVYLASETPSRKLVIYRIFRQGSDVYFLYTEQPKHAGHHLQPLRWRYVVDGQEMATVHWPGFRLLMPNEEGDYTHFRIDGQDVLVRWYTVVQPPATKVSREQVKESSWELQVAEVAADGQSNTIQDARTEGKINETVPAGLKATQWPAALAGMHFAGKWRPNEFSSIQILRNSARGNFHPTPPMRR